MKFKANFRGAASEFGLRFPREVCDIATPHSMNQTGKSLRPALLWWLLASLGMISPGFCADAPRTANPRLAAVAAFPALVAAAQSNHIWLNTFAGSSGTNALQPGDSAAVLITFVQKEKRRQWLLYFEATAPDPKNPPPKNRATFVVTSSFGPPQKFHSVPVAAKLRLLGPFAPVETDAQFFLNQDFLGLGLDQSAALLARWSKTNHFSGPIYSQAIKAMNPTPAEQRAICATFPALFSYADIVQHTEGLDDLFFKLVDFPSLWSVVSHFGVKMDFSFGNGRPPGAADPADWNLPASASVYYFPWLLCLNQQPAMKVILVVTDPRPPRLICGGVTGILAESAGSADTYMSFRLIGAKCAGPQKSK